MPWDRSSCGTSKCGHILNDARAYDVGLSDDAGGGNPLGFASKVHTYIHTYIHGVTHTYTHTYMHTYIHTYMHTYIHTYIHTWSYTYIHTHIHTCIHTYIHTCMRTYIHTYIHACVHTHIHTHIHGNPLGFVTKVRAAPTAHEASRVDEYIEWTLYGIKPDTAKPPLKSLQIREDEVGVNEVGVNAESVDGIRMTMFYYAKDLNNHSSAHFDWNYTEADKCHMPFGGAYMCACGGAYAHVHWDDGMRP